MSHRDAYEMPSRTPAPLRPCDLFSEEIHLLVDRELDDGSRQVVEDHLQQCTRCNALAAHLERMSSVLKAWDQRENERPVPEERLQRVVLSRVAESGARRRRDDRFVRVLHLATAAVVVLGLTLAAFLGLGAHDARGPDPVFAVSDAPWPLENRARDGSALSTEPFEDRITAEDLLAGVQEPVYADLAGDPQVVSDEHMRVFAAGDSEGLINLDMRIKRLEQFMDRCGERAMFWNGPYGSGADQRVVPERTYRFMMEKGLVTKWRDMSTRTSPTVARPSDVPVTQRATGVLAKDMLAPMPGVTSSYREARRHKLVSVPGILPRSAASRSKSAKARMARALPPLVEAYAIVDPYAKIAGLRSGPLHQPNRAFLDPVKAWANGQLRFAESQHDAGRIVAFVRKTTKPIFIPAGQFITDGHGDRVVRHPIWLPASKGETPHIIHCHVVQAMPHAEARGVPQLSPHVAGPTLRALLAAGADQKRIKEAARAIALAWYQLRGARFDELRWSVLPVHTGVKLRDGKGRVVNGGFGNVRWSGTHGFLAVDAQGRFLGFELLRIEGASAEALLDRLWHGYTVEAYWRTLSPALRDAFAAPSDGAQRVLGRLASHPAGFRIPDGVEDVHGVRVSTLGLEASGVHLHALEVGKVPAVVSGLASK